MKTKKHSGGNSKNERESRSQEMRRKRKPSPTIKPQPRTPRGRKALKERKNTLKIKGKSVGVSAKMAVKTSLIDPEPAFSAAVAKSGSAAKGIIDKEKLKKLLSGVAQSKEVEMRSEPTKGKHSVNNEVEKRTFQTMHKENILKPIIDKDKLKKILNGLSQAKDSETRESGNTPAELRPGVEGITPVVNKDKLKTLLNKVYELREGERRGNTSNEVIIVENHSTDTNLGFVSAKANTSENRGDERVKRRRESRSVDSLKNAKLKKQNSILGFKDKLRGRAAAPKINVTTRHETTTSSDRRNRKDLATKDDDVTLLKNQQQSKCKDKSTAVMESDQRNPSPAPVKGLTCNFDKQKLMRLLSGVPQIQELTAKTSLSVSSANTSCPASNPKQLTDGEPQVTEAPFSLSNELLKSNVMTKSGDGSITLRGIMIDRLNAARFRYINEQLYMSTGEEAQHFFTKDPEAFSVYHQGYQSQVNKWPVSPLSIIIDDIARRKQPLIIADFGCGDAKLAKSVPNKVHSFDLVALNEHVTACNMAKVPLKSTSVDVAVFCLSLMGTNLSEYLLEANRILKMGGILKIAEVESRFESVSEFIKKLENLGFSLMKQDTSHKMFVLLDFAKMKNCTKKHLVNITLHPCLYKKSHDLV